MSVMDFQPKGLKNKDERIFIFFIVISRLIAIVGVSLNNDYQYE